MGVAGADSSDAICRRLLVILHIRFVHIPPLPGDGEQRLSAAVCSKPLWGALTNLVDEGGQR